MTKTATITKRNEYSEDYKRIKNNIEQNWPEWKIAVYNENFANSRFVKKIYPVSSK